MRIKTLFKIENWTISLAQVLSFILSPVLQALETTAPGTNWVRANAGHGNQKVVPMVPNASFEACVPPCFHRRRVGQLWQQHHLCPGARRRCHLTRSRWLLQTNRHHQGIVNYSYCDPCFNTKAGINTYSAKLQNHHPPEATDVFFFDLRLSFS